MRARLLVSILLGTALWTGGCGREAPSPPADLPVPPEGVARERFEALREQARSSDARLVFLGDSITALWNREGQPSWEQLTEGRPALNLGVGGDRTQHLLWRLREGQLQDLRPQAIVLLIGTNNANQQEHPPEEIAAGVQAILDELRERAPEARILLLGILPRGERPCRERGDVLQVNQMLASLDGREGLSFLDAGARFVAPDGSIPQDLMYDFLHLTGRGYELLAEAIEPWLRQNLDPFLSHPSSAESR